MVSMQERAIFPKKYKAAYDSMLHVNRQVPTHIDILLYILVMEREEPTKLLELVEALKD